MTATTLRRRSGQALAADSDEALQGTVALRVVLEEGGKPMLANLMDRAMESAIYELIEDEGTYWGEIPGFQGAWARGATLAGCRRELREALSDWLALRLRLGLSIPVVANLDLNRILQPA